MMLFPALVAAAMLLPQSAMTPAKTPAQQVGGRPMSVTNPPKVWYGPLLQYDGTWRVKEDEGKVSRLDNGCVRTGQFVVCEQTVDDQPPTLLVFSKADGPGRYYSQTIGPDNKAMGRADLTVDGDLWTFTSSDTANGKTTYHRTTKQFLDNETIKFRIESSSDGTTWKTTSSGTETQLHH